VVRELEPGPPGKSLIEHHGRSGLPPEGAIARLDSSIVNFGDGTAAYTRYTAPYGAAGDLARFVVLASW